MTVSEGSVVVASKDQIFSDLDREVVILHLHNGTYYGLDAVGARVWSLVQKPITPAQIQAVLVEEFDVTADQCGRDLLALLDQLATAKLIECTG